MNGVVAANLALRFALELAALVSLAYWGLGAADGAAGWALAIAAPAAFAVAWGVLVSPKARVRLAPAARLVVELVLFFVVALALASSGEVELAVVFLAVAIGSGVVNHLAGRPPASAPRA